MLGGESFPESFRHCPRCGASRTTEAANPFRCGECDFTFYFSPVTAVVGLIVDDDRRLLLLRREKDPAKGKLGLPGGFVDPGETLEAALVREVREETNLAVVEWEYLVSHPNTYAYSGVRLPVTDMCFVCQVESLEPLRAVDGEVTDLHFAHPGDVDLSEMAFESQAVAVSRCAAWLTES